MILHAKRPLTVLELRHALATEPEAAAIDDEALPDEQLLTSLCAGLVVIESKSEIIRLVHYTTQEYLERVQMDHFPEARIEAALSCLTYLMFDHYATVSFSNATEWTNVKQGLWRSYPLLRYAAPHWASHARGEPERSPKVQRMVSQLLEHKCAAVTQLRLLSLPFGRARYDAMETSPLHTAARCGLEIIVETLLDRGASINAKAKEFSLMPSAAPDHTALQYATIANQVFVARLLAKRGAHLNHKGIFGQAALHIAVLRRHHAITELLLQYGADADAKDRRGLTPIMMVAKRGYRVVVLLLITAGANINTTAEARSTSLQMAARNGHGSVVRLLLDSNAEINTQDLCGSTALKWAAKGGHENVLQLLLDAGADVDVKDNNGSTALDFAAWSGRSDVVQLLTRAEADINIKGYLGLTALIAMVYKGIIEVVRKLIEAGADMRLRSDSGLTALEFAAIEGDIAALQLSVEARPNVNARGVNGKAPIDWAVEEDDGIDMELLVKARAVARNRGSFELHDENDIQVTNADHIEKTFCVRTILLRQTRGNDKARDAVREALDEGAIARIQMHLYHHRYLRPETPRWESTTICSHRTSRAQGMYGFGHDLNSSQIQQNGQLACAPRESPQLRNLCSNVPSQAPSYSHNI